MLPTSPSKIKSAAITVASVYFSAWGIYYLAQETIRRSKLRSRKLRFPLKAPLLPPHTISASARVAERVAVLHDPSSSSSSTKDQEKQIENQLAHRNLLQLSPTCLQRPDNWYGYATEYELKNIQNRFASLKILGRWANVVPEWREQGAWEWVFWKAFYALLYKPRIWWDGGLAADQQTQKGKQQIETLLPVSPLNYDRLWGKSRFQNPLGPAAPEAKSTFTWIGQSTCLIQMDGLTILTDPVFGEKPVESFLSPTRMRPVPCRYHDLVRQGRIDVILISHNHFDHLDVSILSHVPPTTQLVVPLGLTCLLVKYGVAASQITEMDWWQQTQLLFQVPVRTQQQGETEIKTRLLDITAIPASHWSARTPLDTNTTLWCSYSVRVSAQDQLATRKPASMFFCGDTGYSPSLFTSIGRALGPFDFACLPIGSYEPRWHMQIQHMHVSESVQVTKDIGSKRAFAMHWGTWQMSDERWDDPYHDLQTDLKARNDPAHSLMAVAFGKTFDIADIQGNGMDDDGLTR